MFNMKDKKTVLKLMNQAIELQQLMFSTDKETSSLVDSVNENKHLKRNAGSDGSESEEDDDDEEIYSDTDEEFEANQGKRKAKDQKPKNLNDMNIKHFKPDLIEGHLEKVNKNFTKFK